MPVPDREVPPPRWSGARGQTSDTFTPLAKTRAALERKAASADVQAARELREHADYYYGSAAADQAWPALLDARQLAVVHRVITDAREGRPSDWITDELVEGAPPLH